MNYYKLSFNPKITEAFNMFRALVQQKYGNNSWSSDTDSFYLVATPNSLEDVQKYVDPSRDPVGTAFAGSESLGLLIEPLAFDEPNLPLSAKEWLSRKTQAVEEMTTLLKRFDQGGGA